MDSQGLFEALTDSAVLLDKAGRIINWNNSAASLFGYQKKEMLGTSINCIYDRNYPFPKLIQDVLSHQKTWHEETTVVHKNGAKGICKSHLMPLPIAQNTKASAILLHSNPILHKKNIDEKKPEAYSQIFHQLQIAISGFWSANSLLHETLSRLDQAEKKIRESELRFHLLAENATDIISRHKPDGTFLYISPACTPTLGYEPEELIEKNIYKLIYHEDIAKVKKAFARRYFSPNNKPITYRLKRKEGEFRWFESNVRLILDEKTRVINEIQLASRDITDRIQDKKARLRGQQLARIFRLSTMEEMASGMAHEISQPLAAIVNYTRGTIRHMQNKDYDFEELRSIMDKVAGQAERAGEIIQRLKNFFCKGQLIKSSCKINNVIRETINLMKYELTSSKTKIEFDLDKSLPVIMIDKIQMQQVLLNLVQNAVEAMQDSHTKDKRIHIQTKINTAKMIEITLHDTGRGFSKEIISMVFKPFFTTKAHGRGMGLAICRSIIEAHGGEFTINPNTSNNSWIRFSIPIST